MEKIMDEPLESAAPWSIRHAWFAGGFVFLWMGVTIVVALFFPFSESQRGIVLSLAEFALILPIGLAMIREGKGWAALGFRKFDNHALGLGCGVIFIAYVAIGIYNSALVAFRLSPQVDELIYIFRNIESPWWLFITGIIIAPLVEEMFFRGFLFSSLRQRYRWKTAASVSSALFALAHLQPTAFIPMFILGYALAYLYHETDSIWPGILMHVSINTWGLCTAFALARWGV